MRHLKMRRLVVILPVIALSLSLLSCGSKQKDTEREHSTTNTETDSATEPPVVPENFDSKYNRLLQEGNGEANISYYQNMMDGTNAMAAIIYLGSMYQYSDPWDYICALGLDVEYGFVEHIPNYNVIDAGGLDLYVVIPRDIETTLAVYEWVITEKNNYQGEKGSLLYEKKDGSPVLVKGNFSEVVPSFCLSLTDLNGTGLTYAPFISGEDGKLHPNEEIIVDNQKIYTPILWDASWYEELNNAYQQLTHNIENELVSWDFFFGGSTIDYDDEFFMYELSFVEGGEARFSYNYGDYEGTWAIVTADMLGNKAVDAAEHMIELHLTCGYQQDDRAKEEISGLFAVNFWTQDEGFYLVPLYGDYLITNLAENTDGIGMSFQKIMEPSNEE